VIRPLFAANWKMNKQVSEVRAYVQGFIQAALPLEKCEVVVAPPSTHLTTLGSEAQNRVFQIAGQNCGPAASGAFTGEIAPGMLKELGADWVLLGHSERRHVFHEDEALIGKRLSAALSAGLKVIFCVGETLSERKQGTTRAVIEKQLGNLKLAQKGKDLVVAYEPVWAIGTGEVATPEQAEEAHRWIAEWCGAELGQTPRILYGGSVKPENSAELMAQRHVDGLLVGGASLEAESFAAIIRHGVRGWESKVSLMKEVLK